jgi:hypothetical protein
MNTDQEKCAELDKVWAPVDEWPEEAHEPTLLRETLHGVPPDGLAGRERIVAPQDPEAR